MDYDYDGINNAAESDASLAGDWCDNDGADINDNFNMMVTVTWYLWLRHWWWHSWADSWWLLIVGTMESFSLIELDAAIVPGQRALLINHGWYDRWYYWRIKDSYTKCFNYPTEEDYEFYLVRMIA